ncbi:MAG: hypothetical protein QNJ08_18795 [Crocosphaera sp.]|nr:hypothetical protein [Crocosphaera sp.]
MTSNTNSLPELDHTQIIASELPEEAQKKLEVIQSLLEPCDRTTYGERLREGAKKLVLQDLLC